MVSSIVRFQFYFFSTVFILLQTNTSTESFKCDEKNAVYCLVKYLRAKGNVSNNAHMKTEKGWQWVIKKNNEDDIDVQWKNWTTIDNKTGLRHTKNGPCISLCLTSSNDTKGILDDSSLSCSQLLCKLLSLKNCTNTTSEVTGEEPDEEKSSPTHYHKSTLSTTPLIEISSETSKTSETPSTITASTTTESVETSSHTYATEPVTTMKSTVASTTKGTTTTINLYSTTNEFKTSKASQEPFSTSSADTSLTTPEKQVSSSTKDITSEILTSTTWQPIITTLSSAATTMYSTSASTTTQTVQSSSDTTLISTSSVGYSTSTEPTITTTTKGVSYSSTYSSPTMYSAIDQSSPSSVFTTESVTEEPLRTSTTTTYQTNEETTTPTTKIYTYSSSGVKEETAELTTESELHSSTSSYETPIISNTPQPTTESPQISEGLTSSTVEEHSESVPIHKDPLICIYRSKIPKLLLAYEEVIHKLQRSELSFCDCCSTEDKAKYILGFLKWYNELGKNMEETEKSKINGMYNINLLPLIKEYSDIPTINDPYFIKNTFGNNYHTDDPKRGYGAKSGPAEHEGRYIALNEISNNGGYHVTKQNSPHIDDNDGKMYIIEYSPHGPDRQMITYGHGGGSGGGKATVYGAIENPSLRRPMDKQSIYSPIEQPVLHYGDTAVKGPSIYDAIGIPSMHADFGNPSMYGASKSNDHNGQYVIKTVREEPSGENYRGEYASIYDDGGNKRKIPNRYGQHGYRYIIIKDREGTRRISEDMLKKIHGKYKVQYVILDRNNHTKNIDLHSIFKGVDVPESSEESKVQRMNGIDENNAMKDRFDKAIFLKRNTDLNLIKRKIERKSDFIPQESHHLENVNENPLRMSLFSPKYESELRRRIVRSAYEHDDNELHESKDGSYHHHLPDQIENSIIEPKLKRVFIPDDQLSSLDYDKISKYVARKLVKRDVLKAYDKPQQHQPPKTRKQEHVKKNLNSFERAYLQHAFAPFNHFEPKSEADIIAELQHGGGIRKSTGPFPEHKHGVYPDKIGLQIISDLQKIRKKQIMRNSGRKFNTLRKREIHETIPNTIAYYHIKKPSVIPNFDVAVNAHGHLQHLQKLNQNNDNNNYNFYEVYPHSKYYSSVKN